VLVHLSQIDSYPLILLEAMACSALPVAIDLAGARNMIATFDGAIVGEADAVEETVRWLVASDLADLRSRGKAVAARVREAYSSERFGNAPRRPICARLPSQRDPPGKRAGRESGLRDAPGGTRLQEADHPLRMTPPADGSVCPLTCGVPFEP
jgi:hypothetical protein